MLIAFSPHRLTRAALPHQTHTVLKAPVSLVIAMEAEYFVYLINAVRVPCVSGLRGATPSERK